MPDENRFAGIGEALEDDPENETEDVPTDETSDGAGEIESTDAGTALGAESSTDETDAATSPGPAFPFSETVQRPLYARERAWNAIEDTLDFEVERELRRNGLRDTETRELHDALLRVAAERPSEIVRAVLEARGIDPEE